MTRIGRIRGNGVHAEVLICAAVDKFRKLREVRDPSPELSATITLFLLLPAVAK